MTTEGIEAVFLETHNWGQIVLKMADADTVGIDPSVEVVSPFEGTHFGTREMTVRDPDGRTPGAFRLPSRTERTDGATDGR
jgi:hypothetical protein